MDSTLRPTTCFFLTIRTPTSNMILEFRELTFPPYLSFPDNPLLFTNFSGLFSVAFFDCTMGPKFSLFAGKMASF